MFNLMINSYLVIIIYNITTSNVKYAKNNKFIIVGTKGCRNLLNNFFMLFRVKKRVDY